MLQRFFSKKAFKLFKYDNYCRIFINYLNDNKSDIKLDYWAANELAFAEFRVVYFKSLFQTFTKQQIWFNIKLILI